VVKTALTAIVSAVVLLLVACSGEDDGSKARQADATTQTPAAAIAGGAGLSVKADKTHAVQPKDEITLTISVTDFRLAPDSIGTANQDGVGHYRVYLDDASGDDYLAVGAESTTKVTVPADINDGSHDLRVVLHNNDKSPLEPVVQGSVLLIVYRL
jgi:ABC-type enterochelin transport system substrate-binding protein